MSQSDYPLRMKVPLLLCVCFSYTQGAINYNILFWSDLSHHSIEGLQRAKMVYLCSVSRDWSFCLWSGFILDPAWCDPCCAWGCHVKFPIMKKPLSSKTVPVFEEVFGNQEIEVVMLRPRVLAAGPTWLVWVESHSHQVDWCLATLWGIFPAQKLKTYSLAESRDWICCFGSF